ncbi:TolC family protein [Alsobacter sp. SYSU M60028]|uniref:TolC family protein n=1 Tax=Alsobacter ponti TaxID=2962936 RepID=A0ABT1LJG2_9HYPH|nr:TolC family protein [Alsobacter ponti]MCP8940383.1 TolC family protein [Alsobacter ponti]
MKRLATAALPLLLAGCVTASPDGGLGPAADVARAELGQSVTKIATPEDAAAASAAVDAALARPLSAEDAVRVALLNNRGLQAAYNELGISEAAYIQASLPANPRVSISKLDGGFDLEVEKKLLVSLTSLLTLPARREIGGDRFHAAQMRAAEATLRLAAETRRQHHRAVAARQLVATLAEAKATTDAVAELARKLGETGGLNKLDQARDFAFAAEVDAQLARARLNERLERERLTRLLGLWGRQAEFRLPAALPPLPQRLRAEREIEAQALARRVDLQAARLELDALAKSLGLTQATRFVRDVDLVGTSKYDRARVVNDDGSVQRETAKTRGLEIEFEIPIFDFGQARAMEAEQRYMQAANLLAEKAVNVRSEAREAYMAWRGAWDIARHVQTRVLPLRRQIQDESLLHYSGMLADVTALVADARARILAQAQAVETLRDFWIADADLRAALAGGGTSGGTPSGGATQAAADAGGH